MTITVTGQIIDKNFDGNFYFYASDFSKPGSYIFLFKLSPLYKTREGNIADEVYLAVPNGCSAFLGDVPKGKYILELIH